MYRDGQIALRVALQPAGQGEGEDIWSYSSTVPVDWAAATLSAFDTLLSHCAAVSYSLEMEVEEGLVHPEAAAMPQVTISAGSMVLELVTAEPTLWGANTLGLLAFLVRKGPELAGLPHRVREKWYVDAAAAELAKKALEELKASTPSRLAGRPPEWSSRPELRPDGDE